MSNPFYKIEYSDIHGYVFKTIDLGTFEHITEENIIAEYDLHCTKFNDRNISLYKDDELLKAHNI